MVFKEQVAGLQYVPLDRARGHTGDAPWLTIGVLVGKDFAHASNGQAFSKWQLADLRGGELRAMLFGDAHATHKAVVGRHAGRRQVLSGAKCKSGGRRCKGELWRGWHAPGRRGGRVAAQPAVHG